MLRLRLVAAAILAATASPLRAVTADEDRVVENLAAFARLYGYVRFFHPSDEAASLDWDAFGVHGAETVRDAPDPAALQRALRDLFHPIAPALRIDGPANSGTPLDTNPVVTTEQRIHWQHVGIQLHTDPGPYRSQRVITGPGGKRHKPLFEERSDRPTHIVKEIGQGLRIRLPLDLPVWPDGRTTRETPVEAAARDSKFKALKIAERDPAHDWALRAAGVIATWNVFQHFHPYLDSTGVKWEPTLRPPLRRALVADSREEYYATLSELAAQLNDGHGYVFGRKTEVGGLPIHVTFVGEELAITATKGDTPLRRGDVILEIDGVPAAEIVRERERYVSGSSHLRRFRALNQFGEGPRGSRAKIIVRRNGAILSLEVARGLEERGFFSSPISPFEFPALAEVRPGIFYVNLTGCDRPTFEEKLPQLAGARGIIFDQRWDGRRSSGDAAAARKRLLQPEEDIIPHLIDSPVQASPMRFPRVVAPDREGWTWTESTWPVKPKAPRFTGRIAFINFPGVVSYGETCMAIIAHHRLATLVGEPTAGCNGNVNFIPLPGGFRIMWTGMEVLKHDRSPFYGIGFLPDYPVIRTLNGIKEGRDEFLERAIAVLETEPPKK